MKIFHTSDWHIGKLVHQIHMTKDQREILAQFIALVEAERPDAIVIAGDLYDRSVPPVEAVELLDEVFSKLLLDLNTPVLAIAGNHDSPDRLSFGNRLLENKGLYISGKLTANPRPITLQDQFGPVNFYLVPYADPATVRSVLGITEIQNHDEAMEAIIKQIKGQINYQERNILVTHGFVIGGSDPEISESERPLSVGGSEYIQVKHFEDFHYTALGHLHSPQKVQYDHVRYGGSLMKYSFSEVHQRKTITVVELDEKGLVFVKERSLKPPRDMRRIQGKIKDLLDPQVYSDTNIDDYLMVTLTDEGELLDAIGKLRAVYPNLLRLERSAYQYKGKGGSISAGKDHQQRSKLALFNEFYGAVTGQALTAEQSQILDEVLEEMAAEERKC